MSEYAIRTELHKLTGLDLLRARKDGNRRYYKANVDHPLYNEIRGLVEKSVGYIGILCSALERPDVSLAFVFGSYATGSAIGESDIDLFVVGKISLRTISKILSDIESRIHREVNVHVFTEEELSVKYASDDHFVKSIYSTEKQFIIGNENDFRTMAL
jgi:predicted nucleotidyltransferase